MNKWRPLTFIRSQQEEYVDADAGDGGEQDAVEAADDEEDGDERAGRQN